MVLTTQGLPAWHRSQGAGEMIRVGIIGTGSRGRGLASLLKDLPGVSITAYCDVIPEAA